MIILHIEWSYTYLIYLSYILASMEGREGGIICLESLYPPDLITSFKDGGSRLTELTASLL